MKQFILFLAFILSIKVYGQNNLNKASGNCKPAVQEECGNPKYKLKRVPKLIGGEDVLRKILKQYKKNLIDLNTGSVTFEFIIDEKGNISSFPLNKRMEKTDKDIQVLLRKPMTNRLKWISAKNYKNEPMKMKFELFISIYDNNGVGYVLKNTDYTCTDRFYINGIVKW